MPEPSGFVLDVLDAKGGAPLRTLTNLDGGEGLQDGVVVEADPYSGVDNLTFTGRPDKVLAQGAEVLRLFIRDENGLHPAFYGALISGNTVEPSETVEPYVASARALLLGSACPGRRYRNQDTALIALDLATRDRHPALKVRAADFPASGTKVDFTATGQLGEALDALLELTENADYGTGVDPSGYVFFRGNTLELSLPYTDSDYASLPTSGEAVTTATLWLYNPEPAVKPWGGAYRPRPYTHESVPDRDLHERYGYVRTRDLPVGGLAPIYRANYTSSGFTNPANAVLQDPTAPATRGTGAGTFTVSNSDPDVLGLRVIYQTSEDAGTVRLRASCGVTYDVELPNTQGELQTLDLPLPPHEGTFSYWSSFRISAAAGGTCELWGVYPLQVDADRLDKLAPVVVPERRPGEVSSPGIKPNAARIKLTGDPRGEQAVPSGGLRWGWNPLREAETSYTLEVPQDAADPKLTRVDSYYRR